MTDRKLALLAMIAVVMAGWAILQSRLAKQTQTRGLFQNAPLIQGLNVDAIAEIAVLSNQGADTLTLKKQDGRFRLLEKDSYPANISAINTLLNNCLDIRVARPITSNPANHPDLGVTDQTAQNAVRFLNAEGNVVTGVLISERKSDPDGAHVRLAGGNDVYFVESPPWISTTPMSYLNTGLVEADRGKIRRVTVRGPEGDYVLTLSDGGTIKLEAMPDGKQFAGTAYQSVFRALESVRFEDVMAAENAPDGLVLDRSYICELEDTTVYTVMLGKLDDKHYATITADFLDTAPVQVGRTETEDDLRKKEAKLLAQDAVQTFAQRHQGWVYVISSFKAEDLTKPLDNLLEESPPPDDRPEPAAEPNDI
jgi:hypothetical protein